MSEQQPDEASDPESGPQVELGVWELAWPTMVSFALQTAVGFVDFVIVANVLLGAIMVVTAQSTIQILLDAVPILAMGLLPLFFFPWGLRNFLAQS